jgi:hypothetical protein
MSTTDAGASPVERGVGRLEPERDDEYWDGDDGPERDTTCKHCHGTGGDPWNDGILPCEHCDGEGYEWWN